MKVAVFTSITGSYLPNARVLAKSVKKFHPEWDFHCLFNDVAPAGWIWENEPFDSIIFSHELGIRDFRKWAFQYKVVEFCTATKGVAAQFLLNIGYDAVLYLDPDTCLFDRIEYIFSDHPNYDVFLTPHITDAEDVEEGIQHHEIAALKHGTFNLGFFAIRNTERGHKFLNWWAHRILMYSHINFNTGLFTDQKWANIAPYMFEGIGVLLDRNINVATWNAKGRSISEIAGKLYINDDPLVMYHFSGFGHDFYWAKKELETFNALNDALISLWDWYATELKINKNVRDFTWHYELYDNDIKITGLDRDTWNVMLRERSGNFDPYSVEGFKRIRRSSLKI